MIPKPTEILDRITNGTLLRAASIEALDCDAILDERDDDSDFEEQWLGRLKLLNEKWETAELSEEAVSLKEDIRRESFLSVSRASGQHEIASYVSDDFELIAMASILEIDDRFVLRLWNGYEQDTVPTPAFCR